MEDHHYSALQQPAADSKKRRKLLPLILIALILALAFFFGLWENTDRRRAYVVGSTKMAVAGWSVVMCESMHDAMRKAEKTKGFALFVDVDKWRVIGKLELFDGDVPVPDMWSEGLFAVRLPAAKALLRALKGDARALSVEEAAFRFHLRVAHIFENSFERKEVDHGEEPKNHDEEPKNPVARYFAASNKAARDPLSWRAFETLVEKWSNTTESPLRRPRVVVVTGADARFAPLRDGVEPRRLFELPRGVLKPEAHAAVVAEVAASKRRWALKQGYAFRFSVTNKFANILRRVGLKNWEFAKIFALVEVTYTMRPDYILWLDHDVWPNPLSSSIEPFINELELMDEASLALGNFRSLNTGVILLKTKESRHRRLLLDWLDVILHNEVDCQPFDQAALQKIFVERSLNQSYSCHKPQCGSLSSFASMCNPVYHNALNKHFENDDTDRCRRRGHSKPLCGDLVDRGLANDIAHRAGIHVFRETKEMPRRLQCFRPQTIDHCQVSPGANFPSDFTTVPWLFAHKSIDLFFREKNNTKK